MTTVASAGSIASGDGSRAALRLFVSAVLPGALAGIQFTGLLLFLNPGIPFTAGAVAAGAARFGGLFAALSLLVHLAVPALRRSALAGRSLPWALSAVLLWASLGAWVNTSAFAFYLPPGVNERLLKAAIWLSLGALTLFYTALLHTVHRRRYGRRSRLLLWAVTLASVYAVLERREAFRPPIFNPPRLSSFAPARGPHVLVVGLPGLSPDLLLPLVEQGRMPFLATLLQQGARARLAALAPPRSSPSWVTLATGKLPFGHGVLAGEVVSGGFLANGALVRLLPVAHGAAVRAAEPFAPRRAVGSDALLALPLWTIAARLGFGVGVVDWPATAPTGGELAAVVSDRYFGGGDRGARSVAPDELAAVADRFRPRAAEMAENERLLFPVERVPGVAEALGGDLWRQGIARRLLADRRDLDALWLRLPGLETVARRTFGGFAAVQFDGARGDRQRRSAAVLASYCTQIDGLLAGLWEEVAGGERLFVLAAPFGVERPSGWRRIRGQLMRDPEVGGSPRAGDGFLLLAGSGVRSGVDLGTVRLEDLMPTLLYRLGLPVGRDLDGRPLTAAFDAEFLGAHVLTFVASYETLPRRSE